MPQAIKYLSRLPKAADIVIVGGGVVGAATAFFAARVGISAVILERRPALCTLTTPASTGAFRLQFDNQEELELVRESVDLFLNFQERTGQSAYDLKIRQSGYLWVTTQLERAERARRLVYEQHAWGQKDIELLDGDQARERWPFIGMEVIAARWRAADGFLDPKALTMGLVTGSEARVLVDCGVSGFRIERGRLLGVVTEIGTVATETAIIAAGPFSGLVAATAGVALPVTTVNRQKIVMPDCDLVPLDAPMTIDDDTGAHWRPALRGAYLLFTDPTTPDSPPTENVPPDHRAALRVMDPRSPVSVARVAPFWKEVWDRGATNWICQAGQYTMTPDHRPLLGPTDVSGLWINSGYSGHGIMGSAAGSRHLIDVLTGVIPAGSNSFRLDREFVRAIRMCCDRRGTNTEVTRLDAHIRSIQVGSQRTRVFDRGSGPPVVALHGWGGRIESMAPALNCLGSGFRAIAFDLPGFGHSPAPVGVWGTADYVAYVGDLLDAIEIPSAYFVAHSFGASTSLYLAANPTSGG